VSLLKIKIREMREKPTNTQIILSVYSLCMAAPTCFGITLPSQSQIATHHITKHNTPIHNILSSAPQLSFSQKA
jgi:hypothetical protein